MALNLGSDVPFFLRGGTAIVAGFGELVMPIAPLQLSLVIAKPPEGISTRDAYLALNSLPGRRSANGTIAWPEGGMCNDFEAVAYELAPGAEFIRDKLIANGCDKVLLCGSGSAVFGISNSPDDVAVELRREGIAAWTARSVRRLS